MEKKLVDSTCNLISIPSVTGSEKEIVNYIENYLKNVGIIKRVNNSLALHIKGQDSTKLFILNGHTDTVPVGKGWTSDPYQPKTLDDKIIGLGSSDMKSGIAIMLSISEIFATNKPPCDLLFMFAEKEEVDGSGTQILMNLLYEEINKYQQTGGLILEPTNANNFGLGNKGNIFCELKFVGEGGHGSVNINKDARAIEQLSHFISNLSDTREDWAKKYSNTLLGKPTINVTSLLAGDKNSLNVIPSTANCTLDIRTTPEFENNYKNEFNKLSAKYGFTYTLPFGLTKHGLCKTNSKIYKIANINYKNMNINTFTGATDQCFFTEKNLPMLIFGPGENSQMHKPDEFVKISNITKAQTVILNLINKF